MDQAHVQKNQFRDSLSYIERDSCHSKVGVGCMGLKELQVSSGQRDKGGRKRPRTSDSKVV